MNPQQNLTAMILPFYLLEKPDLHGRMLQDIWQWNFEELEQTHDYIQWLFPISDKSTFNPNAPMVDEEIIRRFNEEPILQQNLICSLTIMLHFYGLRYCQDEQGNIVIDKSEDYLVRRQQWVHRFDHNYLRITRILKCLKTFGLKKEAQAFYACLMQIYQEDGDRIGARSFQYWTNAVKSITDS